MPRIEVDGSDDFELDIEESNGLSSEFFEREFDMDSGIGIESSEEEKFYYTEQNMNYQEPVADETNSNVKLVPSRRSKLAVESFYEKPKEEQELISKKFAAKYADSIVRSLHNISDKLHFVENIYKSNRVNEMIKNSDKLGIENEDAFMDAYFKNPNSNAKQLFDQIYPNSRNEAEFYKFKATFDEIVDKDNQYKERVDEIKLMNRRSNQVLWLKILDYDRIERLRSSVNSEFKFIRKFYTTLGVVSHFRCECCSTDEQDYLAPIEDFVYVIDLGGQDSSIILPLQCNKCGTFHLLDEDIYNKMRNKCVEMSSKLKTTRGTSNKKKKYSRESGIMQIGCYKPNLQEITELLGKYPMVPVDLIEEIDIDLNTEDVSFRQEVTLPEIDDDWENIKKRFLDTITMIGDAKFKLFNLNSGVEEKEEETISEDNRVLSFNRFKGVDQSHVSKVVKVFANTHSNYPYLKAMAVASAITLLKPTGLNRFSLTSRSFYKVYSLFGDLKSLKKEQVEFLSRELGYNFFDENGVLDEKLSSELFKDLNHMNNDFEKEKSLFIQSLYNNLYFLSYMPISSHKLSESDVNDYLYDEEIKKVVDLVSDLMILNHIAEDWLKNFNPAVDIGHYKLEPKRAIVSAIKNMSDVNRRKSIFELLLTITNQANISLDGNLQFDTIVRFIDSADSINYIGLFLEACGKKDYYDMIKYHSKMKWSYVPSEYKEFTALFQLLSSFNSQSTSLDKFSFYFKNLNVSEKYKSRFVRLFEKKGFIPKKFEGETDEEKFNYYDSLSYSENVVSYLPEEVDKLINLYNDVVKFGKFMPYSGLYKDFGVYYSARDLLYYLAISDVNLNVILNMLNLDPRLATLLVDDNYVFAEPDEVVVKYIDLFNIPLDDSLEMPGESDDSGSNKGTFNKERQRDRIMFILDNYDEVKPMFKDFPGVYNLLLSLIGEVE